MALGTLLLALSVGLLVVAEWFRRRAARRQGKNTSSTEGFV
jgi:spermidine/putrescine transport system permease protein